jgi:hypothetical protein
MTRRLRHGLATFSTALLILMTGAQAAPDSEAWERWTAFDADSSAVIDHGAWDDFLASYVKRFEDGINRVDYVSVTGEDKARLEGYLASLAATPVSGLNRGEQLAYWINLYNALTVKVILDHYPLDSIRDINISPGLFSSGPWEKKLVTIEGEEVSLDDIEHRILRPIWRDRRIHYAVNCASLGCPNLSPFAYTSGNAESMLERAARAYINHPRGAEVRNGRLVVSSIYVWFQEDFGDSDAGVIAHLKEYAYGGLAAALGEVDEIDDDRYDWEINDAGTAEGAIEKMTLENSLKGFPGSTMGIKELQALHAND